MGNDDAGLSRDVFSVLSMMRKMHPLVCVWQVVGV